MKKILRRIKAKGITVRDMTLPYIRNMALNAGLLAGHSDYARFIILGRSRVGSNLLRGLLNSHSHVRVYGEIFQSPANIGWALPGYGQPARTLSLFHNDPVRFLETKAFHKFPSHITAVGFKIFYYHAQTEAWRPLWAYLRREKGIKVIHIKRRNILQTHLSRERAARSDVWFNLSGEKEAQPPLTLDYEACLEDFVQTRQWEEEYDAFFQDHETLEVFYEELAGSYQSEMARVQDFLGLPYETVAPETHKQSRKPLPEAIANYAELKERFQGTPWSEFFV